MLWYCVLLQREVNRRMTQENTARVITIAATEQPQDIRLRVAAYARVSSSSDEQLNSFADAVDMIGTGRYKLIDIDLTGEVAESDGMVCGGTMKILVEDGTEA